MNRNLQAIIKWPGGKVSEAKKILPLIPEFSGRYIDPFVGGGAIFFMASHKSSSINDLSDELVSLYKSVKDSNQVFFDGIKILNNSRDGLNHAIDDSLPLLSDYYQAYLYNGLSRSDLRNKITSWVDANSKLFSGFSFLENGDLVLIDQISKNLLNKFVRLKKLHDKRGEISSSDIFRNFETALHSAFYMYVRHLYNNSYQLGLSEYHTVFFYYIREFCYSSMFRFNNSGAFNVPYGGMAYNSKNFASKIQRLEKGGYQELLANSEIYNLDFEEFLEKISPNRSDFLFLDPPYDSEFRSYNGSVFSTEDHKRLAAILKRLETPFLLVIKDTNFVMDLYGSIPNIYTQVFDKKYMVSFQNRNDKRTKHIIFTNFAQLAY